MLISTRLVHSPAFFPNLSRVFLVLAIANTGKTRERFGKNAGEWTGRAEISKEDIPGSKRSMHGNILTSSRLERENRSALCSHQRGL